MPLVKYLLVFAMMNNISWAAKHEHVYYTCSSENPSLFAFSLHFHRDQNWIPENWHINWGLAPSFASIAIINLPDRTANCEVRGQISGIQAMSGYARVGIELESPDPLSLIILERPGVLMASGEAFYQGERFAINCAVAVEADQSVDF